MAYSCSLSFYVLNSAGFMLVILTMRELKLLLIILCYVVFSRYYGWYDGAYFRSLSFYVLNWAGFSFLLVKKTLLNMYVGHFNYERELKLLLIILYYVVFSCNYYVVFSLMMLWLALEVPPCTFSSLHDWNESPYPHKYIKPELYTR